MAVGVDAAMILPGPGSTERRVFLSGASSQIGVFAIPRLISAGFNILALSRQGRPQGYPEWEQVEWLTGAAADGFAHDCQFFLSAGPLELARNYLATAKSCRAAVVFSSSSVISKEKSTNREENRQIQGMLALESEVRSTAESKGVRLVILRPTLIYGCGLDTSISRLANWIRRFGFMPVNGGAVGLRQPVHAEDLAFVAVTALCTEEHLPQFMFLTGGSTLSYADMIGHIFSALDKPARILRLPEGLFLPLLQLVAMIKPRMAVNSEMARRQNIDLVFNDQQARTLLNYKPRAFNPSKEDLEFPQYWNPQDPRNP